MDTDKFDYDNMVQTALKKVVKKALQLTAQNGLPSGHHFYITFQTNRPDVKLPQYLLDKHPEEITIVLQHQFRNLVIDDDGFNVALSFNNVYEKIRVPFSGLISFLDPYVKFGLQFTPDFIPPVSTPKIKNSKKKNDQVVEDNTNVVTLDAFRKK